MYINVHKYTFMCSYRKRDQAVAAVQPRTKHPTCVRVSIAMLSCLPHLSFPPPFCHDCERWIDVMNLGGLLPPKLGSQGTVGTGDKNSQQRWRIDGSWTWLDCYIEYKTTSRKSLLPMPNLFEFKMYTELPPIFILFVCFFVKKKKDVLNLLISCVKFIFGRSLILM